MDNEPLSREQWLQVRELFDALSELPEQHWQVELQRRTSDQQVVAQTLELLRAPGITLSKALYPLREVLARALQPELRAGDLLGNWRLTTPLGQGGMGAVFLAQRADELYQQKAVVKLLPGMSDTHTAERLDAERRILAGLQHPNIARLYDGGTTPAGQPYLVMEYIDGVPLDAYCKTRQPNLRSRIQLFLKICSAVQAAHERLVVHCDLKPRNVMVSQDGEPILLDFGIARLIDSGIASERIDFCTPAYASPELIEGKAVGVATDVFSLGIVLAEMLAMRELEGDAKRRERPVPVPSQWATAACPWRKRLRGDLDAIVAKACAREPANRYSSVAALANDLHRYLGHYPIRARKRSWWYLGGRGLRRHWQGASFVAVTMFLCVFFIWNLIQARDAAQQEAQIAQQITDFLVTSFEAADPRKRGVTVGELSARALLDAGASRIDKELSNAPAQLARLKAVLGKAYQHMGQPRQAEAMLREAAQLMQGAQVQRPGQALSVLTDLSVLLSNSGRHAEAEETAQRALQLLGKDKQASLAQAEVDNAMGLALMGQQRFAEAERHFMRSLSLRSSLDSSEQGRGLSTALHNLGLLYHNRGEHKKAEQALREALRIRHGLDSHGSEYQSSLHALGMALVQQGRLQEAAQTYEESLQLALRLYGENSLYTGNAYGELASIYQDLGDYNRALDAYAKSREITVRISGENSVKHAIELNNLATLQEARGDTGQAEALYRRSWEIRRQQLGEDAPASLRAEINLGRLLMRTGRLQQARPLIERVLEQWSARLEGTSPDLLLSRLALIEWQMRSGAYAEARSGLAQSPPTPDWSAGASFRHHQLRAELASLAGEAGATALWTRALLSASQLYGERSVPTAKVRLGLAESLARDGEQAKAREQLLQIQDLLRAQLLPQSEPVQRMQQLSAQLSTN